MADEFDRGVMITSSWHQKERVAEMATAEDMIRHGHDSGAWPIGVELQRLMTPGGLPAKARAVVASYLRDEHPDRVVGEVGERYHACDPAAWADLTRAAVLAGAKPDGCFSLRDGRRILATFDVGRANGIRTKLAIVDSFDGSMRLQIGFTSIRVVCANTLGAAQSRDGKNWHQIRHTASLDGNVRQLTDRIGEAIASGESLKETMARAERTVPADHHAAFDLLFPPATDDDSPAKRGRANAKRSEALIAMSADVNKVGDGRNVATLWNAATYLVDRRADGSHREARGGESLDSLLFGSRAKRLQEVQELIAVIMADGTERHVSVPEATAMGVDTQQMGAAVLADMLAELD